MCNDDVKLQEAHFLLYPHLEWTSYAGKPGDDGFSLSTNVILSFCLFLVCL